MRLRWHEHRVLPPYPHDPQDKITVILRDPSFHDPWGDVASEDCVVDDDPGDHYRYHCTSHNRAYIHGGLHCPDHVAHEIALECEVHGLECMWPQPIMLASPAGFDPPLTARQLAAAEADPEEG